MAVQMHRAEAAQALLELGISPGDIAKIRSAPLPMAKELLARLKAQARKQYKKLALELHPDRTGGDPAKTERFTLLTRIFEDFNKLQVQAPVQRLQIHQAVSGMSWVQVRVNVGKVTQKPTARPSSSARPMHVVNMRP